MFGSSHDVKIIRSTCWTAWIVVVAAWGVLVSISGLHGAVIYVDRAAAGAADGTTWANAYTTLQPALAAANGNDEIWVASGTYSTKTGDSTVPSQSFTVASDLSLYGGFLGTAHPTLTDGETTLEQRDWTANQTVLSGDIGNNDNTGVLSDNSYHVVFVSSSGTAVLDGFTITGGNANGSSSPDGYGGGIYCAPSSQVTVRNCVLRQNHASRGGGLHVDSATATLTNCVVERNSADSFGGGIFPHSATLTLTNCIVAANSAGDLGGGLFILTSASVTIVHTTIAANEAVNDGGGIYRISSTITVDSSIIWGNDARSSGLSKQIGGGTVTASYSAIQDWSSPGSDGNIDADPVFADPEDPGGADDLFGTADDGLQLLAGSPCIDAGSAMAAGFSSTDFLRAGRFDDPAVANTGTGIPDFSDMGAYERQAAGPILIQADLTDPFSISEGGTVSLELLLGSEPIDAAAFHVTATGDADVTVNGGTLEFDDADWDTTKSLTIAAAEDDADAIEGTAVIAIQQTGGSNPLIFRSMTVCEDENDVEITVGVFNDGSGIHGTTTPSGTVIVPKSDLPLRIAATPEAGYGFERWRFDDAEVRFNSTLTEIDDLSADLTPGDASCYDPENIIPCRDETVLPPCLDTVIRAVFRPLPAVTITAPAAQIGVVEAESIAVTVVADGHGVDIERVEIFLGDTLLGEDLSAPYTFSFNAPVAGSYALIAKATDDDGLVGVSTAVHITVTPFTFAFSKPGPTDPNPTVRIEDDYRFFWQLSALTRKLEFDLHLHPPGVTIPITLAELAAAPKLNTTPLDSTVNVENYFHTTSFPVLNGADTEWTPFIRIRTDGALKDSYFYAADTFTVTPQLETQVTIQETVPGPATAGGPVELFFGESITITAAIFSDTTPIDTEKSKIILKPPDPRTDAPDDCEAAYTTCDEPFVGRLTDTFTPDEIGQWRIEARHEETNDFDFGNVFLDFEVLKSRSKIQLFSLGSTHLRGAPVTVSGRVGLLNGNPGMVSLGNLTVLFDIRDPVNAIRLCDDGSGGTSPCVTTTDTTGNFALAIPGGFLDSAGDWNVRVQFAGNANMEPSNEFALQLKVRDAPGYAILCLGALDNAEGRTEHKRTLNYVESVLTDAGITQINRIEAGDTLTSPEASLGTAIRVWARDRILSAPAPLHIALINHGDYDVDGQGEFHMFPDTLTPTELDAMLDDLETSLAADPLAAAENIILTLGMCHAGLFTSALAGPTRLVISAAAPAERSVRGPGLPEVREGEYFVYLFFRELRNGRSVQESFRNSRKIIRSVTADLFLKVNGLRDLFPEEEGQHPLLFDPDSIADDLFLITASDDLPAPDASSGLRINRTSPTTFLSPSDSPPDLFAEMDVNPSAVLAINLEVKPADAAVTDVTTGRSSRSMQASLDFIPVPLTETTPSASVVRYEFSLPAAAANPDRLFVDPGLHQAIFYAVPFSGNGLQSASVPRIVKVYRASRSDALADFELISPGPNGTVNFDSAEESRIPNALGIFRWERSHSEAGSIRYIYSLWTDRDRTDLVFESELLVPPFIAFTSDDLPTGTFWWDVVAVDRDGNFRYSTSIHEVMVTLTNSSSIPGFITGILTDSRDGAPIADGLVTIPGVIEEYTDDGYYLGVLNPGNDYVVTAQATGYTAHTATGVSVMASATTELDFALRLAGSEWELAVASSPPGIDIGSEPTTFAGQTDYLRVVDHGTTIVLTAPTTAVVGTETYAFVRWSVEGIFQRFGETAVTIDVTGGRQATAVYQLNNGITLRQNWNLVATPVDLPDSAMSAVFNDPGTGSSLLDGAVYHWHGSLFEPTNEIKPGRGYWLRTALNPGEDRFISTVGEAPGTSLQPVFAGWNLIGVKGIMSIPVLDDPNILGPIWAWDNTSQTYLTVTANGSLLPGQGYWIYVRTDGSIVLGSP